MNAVFLNQLFLFRDLVEVAVRRSRRATSVLDASVSPQVDESRCVFEIKLVTRLGRSTVDQFPLLAVELDTTEVHRLSHDGEVISSLGRLEDLLEETKGDLNDLDIALWGS